MNADDVAGPSSPEQWSGAIQLLHAALGLTKFAGDNVYDVFIDVRDLSRTI
jgi:hypothetical protein